MTEPHKPLNVFAGTAAVAAIMPQSGLEPPRVRSRNLSLHAKGRQGDSNVTAKLQSRLLASDATQLATIPVCPRRAYPNPMRWPRPLQVEATATRSLREP